MIVGNNESRTTHINLNYSILQSLMEGYYNRTTTGFFVQYIRTESSNNISNTQKIELDDINLVTDNNLEQSNHNGPIKSSSDDLNKASLYNRGFGEITNYNLMAGNQTYSYLTGDVRSSVTGKTYANGLNQIINSVAIGNTITRQEFINNRTKNYMSFKTTPKENQISNIKTLRDNIQPSAILSDINVTSGFSSLSIILTGNRTTKNMNTTTTSTTTTTTVMDKKSFSEYAKTTTTTTTTIPTAITPTTTTPTTTTPTAITPTAITPTAITPPAITPTAITPP
ncbi:hypothetical protein SNEBB_003477, partial [Seison nebaliae]